MTGNAARRKGRFWVNDSFIDKRARNLSAYEQMVFIALCRHANAKGLTFIGYRKLGQELGFNKNTVQKCVTKLEAYGLVIRLSKMEGQPSHLKVVGVRFGSHQPGIRTVHKEDIKEEYKEGFAEYFQKNMPEIIRKIGKG